MQYKLQPDKISITAGSIDGESVKGVLVKPSEHIFLGEKAGWFEIPDDGLERYARFCTEFDGKLENWKKGLNTSEKEGRGE